MLTQVISNTFTVEVGDDISILCHHLYINLLLLLLVVRTAKCNGL